ncbi:hypothetical protein GF371_02105 [Candidatus Woesearchaeota archaeon]|nr:hypothetical protein [Candidatus Woesearchaeota archaeon]
MSLKELEEHYDDWAETYDEDADDWSYNAHGKIVARLWKNDIYLAEKRVIDLACGMRTISSNPHGPALVPSIYI